MENKNYTYNSVKFLMSWAKKRVQKTPKTALYVLLFLCLSTISAGMIGYHFNDSEYASRAGKFKDDKSKLLAELERMENENQELHKKFKEVEEALTEIEEKDRNIYRTIYDMRVNENIDSVNKEIDNYTAEDIEKLIDKIEIESKSLDEVFRSAGVKDANLSSMPVLKPVADKYVSRLASGYGSRFHPILKVNKMHKGLDFAASTGTPIYATGDGYESLYAHMSRAKVRSGQKVKRGDVIGYVGSTGLSTGAHLHYEIHKNGEPVDPIMYFYNDVDPDDFIKIYQNSKKLSLSLD